MKHTYHSEFDIINMLQNRVKIKRSDVIFGVGDDTAVLKQSKSDYYQLLTCDSQIEGVHFKRGELSYAQIGQRAVAVSLSDIAAMGGKPTYLLVSLVLGKDDSLVVDEIYDGILALCRKYHISLIGGNLTSANVLMLDTFLLGAAAKNHLITRRGAQPGDSVLVTGTLGDAVLSRTHIRPRLKEAQILAKSGKVTAMIDISDGLSNDILHICEASGVGVAINESSLPLSAALQKFARAQGEPAYAFALNRGEDYELCFTTSPQHATSIKAMIEKKTGVKVTVIGKMLQKKQGDWLIDTAGKKRPLVPRGWDHLSV